MSVRSDHWSQVSVDENCSRFNARIDRDPYSSCGYNNQNNLNGGVVHIETRYVEFLFYVCHVSSSLEFQSSNQSLGIISIGIRSISSYQVQCTFNVTRIP
jgi:hypothetical protein